MTRIALALFCGASIGCLQHPRGTPVSTIALPTRDSDVIREQEIAGSGGANAYEVMEHVRPRFLSSRVDLESLTERHVYLDGVRLGGLDELRHIAASAIREIRFSRSTQGSDRGGAAILLISKIGRD